MNLRRWMLFVDGENFAIRAAEVAKAHNLSLTAGTHYIKDVFCWLPAVPPTYQLTQPDEGAQIEGYAIRSYYYTSLVGDESRIQEVRRAIRTVGFQPQVFKRQSNQRKSKGVDITLTKDMLVHAFNRNYDVAVLIAGDGDYVPVVEELKRMGRMVYVLFFADECGGLSEELRLACDKFFNLTQTFKAHWERAPRGSGVRPTSF